MGIKCSIHSLYGHHVQYTLLNPYMGITCSKHSLYGHHVQYTLLIWASRVVYTPYMGITFQDSLSEAEILKKLENIEDALHQSSRELKGTLSDFI